MIGSQQYLETEVLTASPHRLHQMVVDAALRFARQAEQALELRDFEAAHLALGQSRDLVGELIGGLDETHAPELVQQLKALFVFVYRNLANADMLHDPQAVRSAIRILSVHRETWVSLQAQIRENAAAGHKAASEDTGSPGRCWTT